MRFMRGEAYVSAKPERAWTVGYQRFATDTFARGHGVSDSVPDDAHALDTLTGHPAFH